MEFAGAKLSSGQPIYSNKPGMVYAGALTVKGAMARLRVDPCAPGL